MSGAPIGLLFAALAMAQLPVAAPELPSKWGSMPTTFDQQSWEWDWKATVLTGGFSRICSPYELVTASMAVDKLLPPADGSLVTECERDAAIRRWRLALEKSEWITEEK